MWRKLRRRPGSSSFPETSPSSRSRRSRRCEFLVDEVRAVPQEHVWTIPMKLYLAPEDLTSNRPFYHAYLHTQVYAPQAGERVDHLASPAAAAVQDQRRRRRRRRADAEPDQQRNATPIELKEGWNTLLLAARGSDHLPEVVMVFDVPEKLRFATLGEDGGSPWALVGPFALSEKELDGPGPVSTATWSSAGPRHQEATVEAGERVVGGRRPGSVPFSEAVLPADPSGALAGGQRLRLVVRGPRRSELQRGRGGGQGVDPAA